MICITLDHIAKNFMCKGGHHKAYDLCAPWGKILLSSTTWHPFSIYSMSMLPRITTTKNIPRNMNDNPKSVLIHNALISCICSHTATLNVCWSLTQLESLKTIPSHSVSVTFPSLTCWVTRSTSQSWCDLNDVGWVCGSKCIKTNVIDTEDESNWAENQQALQAVRSSVRNIQQPQRKAEGEK